MMRMLKGCALLSVALMLNSCEVFSQPPVQKANPLPRLEFGIDRSNMGTEWTLSPPGLPNIYPFNGPYNGPGVFEARRTAVFDGIGRMHPQWFRDGFEIGRAHV